MTTRDGYIEKSKDKTDVLNADMTMGIKTFGSKLCLMAAIALTGCATYNEIYSSYDESVDFTKYQTYAWLNSDKHHTQTPYDNDVIVNNAKSYADRDFEDRGYRVDTVQPDVLLELVLKSEKEKEVVVTSNPYDYSNFTYYNTAVPLTFIAVRAD